MNQKERAAPKREKRLTAPASALSRGIDELAAEARRCFDRHDFASAQKLCKDILARAPLHVDGMNLLGLMAQESARHAKAVRFFNKAIAADPYNAACHYNIGASYEVLNDRDQAAAHFKEALALGLSRKDAGQLVMQSAVVAACLDRIKAAWPRRPSVVELFGAPGIAALANDVFLCCALETSRLDGLVVERFLTDVRWALLQIASDAAPAFEAIESSIVNFCSALAQQYFRNEYVYAESSEEVRQVNALRDLLQEKLHLGSNIDPFLPAVVAAYVPLHTLPNAELLRQMEWPNVLTGLIRQQLLEPFEEAGDRNAIPTLTAIADKSAPVRRMYEENPFPRWTMITKDALPLPPGSDSEASAAAGDGAAEILVAGCGTGSKAIITALSYPNAKVLAIDMSLASLAYARRKAREANVRNIEFAQADIMNLGSIGRRFDRIEVIGVLQARLSPDRRRHSDVPPGAYSSRIACEGARLDQRFFHDERMPRSLVPCHGAPVHDCAHQGLSHRAAPLISRLRSRQGQPRQVSTPVSRRRRPRRPGPMGALRGGESADLHPNVLILRPIGWLTPQDGSG